MPSGREALPTAGGDRADHLPAVSLWLDDLHTLEENKANRLKRPMERRVFPEDTHRAALAELDALFASLQRRAFSGELTRPVASAISERFFREALKRV